MKVAHLIVSAAFLGTLALSSLTAALAMQPPPVDLTGTWNGTSSDQWLNPSAPPVNGMVVTWVLTQTDSTVSGTVTTTSLNGNDGSCSGCHRAKTGTLTGTLSSGALTLTMDFPGHAGEPSPTCTATFSTTSPAAIAGTLPSITSQPASRRTPTGQMTTLSVTGTAADQATVLYSGADSCEGQFTAGSLPMTRTTSPLGYQWYAGASGTTSSPIAGANASTYITPPITAAATFWVRVSNAYGSTVDSATAALTPYQPFTDDVLSVGSSVIRTVHIQELRTRIDALRVRFGLPAYPYADATLTAGTTSILVQHVIDLRAALAAVYTAAGGTLPTYTDPNLAAGVVIKRAHVDELRIAVESIE